MAIYLLRSLMRMVAMRRMLERILIIQLSITSNGSSFNLVSTYLQIMSSASRCTTMRCDVEIFALWAHHSPLCSQRLCRVTRLGGQHAIAMATIGPELLRWKATPPPLCPPALYRRMALPLKVCQAQHGGSRTASQEYTDYKLIWK